MTEYPTTNPTEIENEGNYVQKIIFLLERMQRAGEITQAECEEFVEMLMSVAQVHAELLEEG